MEQYIKKATVVAEIKRRLAEIDDVCQGYITDRKMAAEYILLNELLDFLDTIEVIDPYEQCIQYDSIKTAIKAHAETYLFNIESKLFNQLTKEQQELWRKEIEQACISGGDAGYLLAKDPRYKENLEVKENDLVEELDYNDYMTFFKEHPEYNNGDWGFEETWTFGQYCYELGLKAQK